MNVAEVEVAARIGQHAVDVGGGEPSVEDRVADRPGAERARRLARAAGIGRLADAGDRIFVAQVFGGGGVQLGCRQWHRYSPLRFFADISCYSSASSASSLSASGGAAAVTVVHRMSRWRPCAKPIAEFKASSRCSNRTRSFGVMLHRRRRVKLHFGLAQHLGAKIPAEFLGSAQVNVPSAEQGRQLCLDFGQPEIARRGIRRQTRPADRRRCPAGRYPSKSSRTATGAGCHAGGRAAPGLLCRKREGSWIRNFAHPGSR